MSHTYKPSPTGSAGVDTELARLQTALNSAQAELYFDVRNAAPVRKKAGLVVYADGVNWNPGSGEGLYRYSMAGAWVFIG